MKPIVSCYSIIHSRMWDTFFLVLPRKSGKAKCSFFFLGGEGRGRGKDEDEGEVGERSMIGIHGAKFSPSLFPGLEKPPLPQPTLIVAFRPRPLLLLPPFSCHLGCSQKSRGALVTLSSLSEDGRKHALKCSFLPITLVLFKKYCATLPTHKHPFVNVFKLFGCTTQVTVRITFFLA